MIGISPKIIISLQKCILCRKCVRSCPAEILVISKNDKNLRGTLYVTEPNDCFECRACEVVCPVNAITVHCDYSQTKEEDIITES